MRLVIHPGFHKTGTKSVQTALRDNASVLAPYLRVLLREDLPELIDRARGYSRHPTPRRMQSVYDAALAVFETLDPGDHRPVLISSEDLSGYMPGRRDVFHYRAVPAIMAQIERAALARFGADAELSFYFSTRAPKPWLTSLWWQNLRGTRLDMPLKRYLRVSAELGDLDLVVAAVASGVTAARVDAVSLDITADLPEGPLAPLLELVGLPTHARSALRFGPPANVRPGMGLEDVFLALNRSGLPDDVVAGAKRDLLRAARRDDAGQKENDGND